MQVSTGCCITQGGVTAGDGEDCDADTGNWFAVSSTLPSLHWGHLQRDQPPDVAQMSLATQTQTQAGDSYHHLKIRPPMIFCSRNQVIIQTTKHGLFTAVSCRNVLTPAGSPVGMWRRSDGCGDIWISRDSYPRVGRIFTTV